MGKKNLIKFRNFVIDYNNIESAKQTIAEIFNELPYNFTSNKKKPFIIDGGSNIGLATLFFKEVYPNAEILCFEPDPNAFKMLQKNIAINQITGTTLVNSALSKQDGEVDFFGQIFVDSPDARGNSIINTWGTQRTISNTTKVKSAKLSYYINSEVDFLKLDIEGAEQQVLEDLEKENKLKFIKEMVIEFHESCKIQQVNDINILINLLSKHNFKVDVLKKNTENLLPEQISNWIKQIDPHLFTIQAIRL